MRGAHWSDLPAEVLAVLRRGAVLPAHPLALDERRQFDRQSQRALSRYYIDAGAGGDPQRVLAQPEREARDDALAEVSDLG